MKHSPSTAQKFFRAVALLLTVASARTAKPDCCESPPSEEGGFRRRLQTDYRPPESVGAGQVADADETGGPQNFLGDRDVGHPSGTPSGQLTQNILDVVRTN